MSIASTDPTPQDLEALRSKHQLALAALDRTYWAGGGPIYPEEVNKFMSSLVRGPWHILGYDRHRTQQTLANLSEASLDDIRQLFLHFHRSERFTTGAWTGLLEGDVPFPEIFDRLESLVAPRIDLHAPKPAIDHPLAISAMRQARVWFFMTLVPIALGLLVESLRTHGHIARGNQPTPLFILAAGFAFVWVFCLLVGWRGQRELARIRRGDYLARWPYGGGGVGADAVHDRRRKVQLLFFVPLIAFALGGLVLGGIGSYMKGNGHLLWSFGLGGAAIGLGLGLLVAVPAWFLMGIRIAIAEKLPSETIFTASGFYQPGRFVPVKSWSKVRRDITLKYPDRYDSRARLDFKLHQHNPLKPELPKGTTAHFIIPVPEGREDEAMALVEHYRD